MGSRGEVVKQSMLTPKFQNNIRFHRSISPNFLKPEIAAGNVLTHEGRLSLNQITSYVKLYEQQKISKQSTFGVTKGSD